MYISNDVKSTIIRARAPSKQRTRPRYCLLPVFGPSSEASMTMGIFSGTFVHSSVACCGPVMIDSLPTSEELIFRQNLCLVAEMYI